MTGVACRSRERMRILRLIGRARTQKHIFPCLPTSVDGASLGVSRALELPIDMQSVATLIHMCFISLMLEWGYALPQLRFVVCSVCPSLPPAASCPSSQAIGGVVTTSSIISGCDRSFLYNELDHLRYTIKFFLI